MSKKILSIVEKLKAYKPEKVVLFGSYANGKNRVDSDLDLLIIKNTKQNPYERIPEVRKYLMDSDFAFDILVMTEQEIKNRLSADDFFIKDIPNLYLPSYIDFLMNVKFANKIKNKEKNNINKLLDAKAEDIMTKDCVLITAGDPIEDLINIFRSKHLSTIPVVDNKKRVIGVVTLADIIKLVKLNN